MRFLIINTLIIMSSLITYQSETSRWLKGSQLLLEYKIQEPKDKNKSGKNPVVILLHGVGSNEADLFQLKEYFPKNYYVISARAPYKFGYNSYGWYEVDFSTGKPVYNKEQSVKSKQLIVQFLNQLLDKYDIDKEQVYLFGFSQGAIMSYSVAVNYPNKIKGIIAMSGRMLEEDQQLLEAKKSLDVDIFISHSQYDNVLPYSHAQTAKGVLESKANSINFYTHDKGHSVDLEILRSISNMLKS